MHDKIISLLDVCLRTGKINPKRPRLISRKKFIHKVQKDFKTTALKPKHVPVLLSDGPVATVSVYNIEYIIICLLTDDALMMDENIAAGYDLFTGDVNKDCKENEIYGEVHTGDAWKPACKHYCGTDGDYMPVSLLIFGDKTHTNLHGSLAVTPIIFPLSLFNSTARNNP